MLIKEKELVIVIVPMDVTIQGLVHAIDLITGWDTLLIQEN